MQYFDADYTVCYFINDWANMNFLTIPPNFMPSDYIPPMPAKVVATSAGLWEGGYQGLLPLL